MSFSRRATLPFSRAVSVLAVGLALAGGGACAPQDVGGPTQSVARAATASPGNVDILVMVDNSSSMTSMQQKMVAQFPAFISSLEALPLGLPNIHLAVVSSDMGAPSDVQDSIQCSVSGDSGVFFSKPEGTCTATTLATGATFISNVDGVANYTGDLGDLFSCIALLGDSGCGFEHQLASVARALGADGQPPPATNTGFLRDDAELAILILTNEDDCSAPASATPLPIFSLNGGTQSITNPYGPLGDYRCNGVPLGGHLCNDPTGTDPTALVQPPLNPPADAANLGTTPTLNLTNCESNETASSGLTNISTFISGIKALKADPDNDIVVAAIMGAATPYTVEWVPGSGVSNELWPQVQHACGPASSDTNPAGQISTDETFGDPTVRLTQWVKAFGDNGITASICDADYAPAFQQIANKIGARLQGASSGSGGVGGGAGSGAGGQGGAGGIGGSGAAGHGGNGGLGGSGAAGHGGLGGAAGTSGGAAGTTGAGGNSGAAGTSGGSAGTNGSAGTSGSAGGTSGGATGTSGGSAGTNGSAGTSGGSAGTSGGSAGTSGGAAGTSGGSAGTNGSTGTSGSTAGTSGSSAGTSGTSGGSAGTSGAGGVSSAGGGSGHAGSGGRGGAGAGGAAGQVAEGSSGCSCETGGGSSRTAWSLPLFAGLLFARRRQKRKI
jgi:hypothetical protein